MSIKRNLWTIVAGLAVAVILAGSASAAPTPSAGGNRTVTEDVSNTYTGTDASGQGVNFGWIFAGAVVDGISVSYTFATPGSYAVSFWADDTVGGNVSDSIIVTVTDVTAPSAAAGVDQNVNEDALVTFDGSSSSDNDPNFGTNGRYYWTFTDGSTARSLSGKVQTYTFNTPGSYIVNLLVFDNAGNFASDSLVVNAKDITPPSGGGTVPASANEDTVVSFSSSAITDNDPSFAGNRRDYWTFTDGVAQNLSGTSRTYTFNTPGTFSVTLTVMDITGNKLTSVFSITIVDTTAPTGSGTIPSPSNEDSSITFNAASITDNDPNFAGTPNRRIYWTFTDGVAQNLSSPAATGTSSYTFNTPGTFSVTLTVMDATGNKLTQVISVTIRDITAPIGVVTITRTINEDVSTTFDASTITDNDPTFLGTPNRRVYWTFTDGVTPINLTSPAGTAQSSYTFATPGSYAVTLVVMDNTGNRYTSSGTVTVIDLTAPTGLVISGGGVSLERFRSTTLSGVSSDNVAVVATWWLFTDGSAFNVSGNSLLRTWSNTGVFAITYYARDAAFNIASVGTTLTITADITPPTVTFASQPTTGDDQTLLFYSASAVDLDPACAASCNWTWQKDGANFAFGVQSLSIQWTPGRHTLNVLVRDPTGNTRNQSTAPATIDIDQVVLIDTLVTGQTFNLNWNIRVQSGATLTWRNSFVYSTTLTPARTVVVTVSSGRFILENTQVISNSSTYGFRFSVNGSGGAGSYMYVNQSTISGLYYDANVPALARAPISINAGTLSVKDSTLRDVRLTGSSSTPVTILGTDANLYLNNVTLDAQVTSTMGGIRADYTGAITVLQSREIVIDRLDGRSGRTVFQFTSVSTTGTVNATILNSLLRSSTSSSSNRAIDIALTSNSGTYNFRLAKVDAANNNYGGLYFVASSFTGVSNLNITDTTFDNAISSNGIYTQWLNSNARFSTYMNNVSASRAAQFGWQQRFESSGWNQGTLDLTQVHFDNSSTQTGWYLYQYNTRVTLFASVTDCTMNFNRQGGLWIDSTYGQNSVLSFTFTRCQFSDNQQLYGVRNSIQYASFNDTMNFIDSNLDRNYQDNYYFYHYATDGTSAKMRGQYNFNMTRSSFSSSQQGRGIQFYMYYYAQQNVSANWVDSVIENNRMEGVFYYHGYLYSNGQDATESNLTVQADRVSISRNGQDGFYAYDYYMYGYLTYTCNPACGYFQVSAATRYDVYFNNSHIDQNSRRGFEWYGCPGYCNYGAAIMHLHLLGNTTTNNNAASGVYLNFWYAYTYGWLGGTSIGPGASEMTVEMDHSESVGNGFSGSDGYGIYSGFYFSYGMGPMLVKMDHSRVVNNAGTGIYLYHQNNYFGSTSSDGVWINSSNISSNGVRGLETYYYQVYQMQSGVVEYVNNTTFYANAGGQIQTNTPEAYGRYQSPWAVEYTYNTFDNSPTTAIARAASQSCQGCGGQGGSERFDISNNRFTNIQGAAVAWGFDPPSSGASVDVNISDNYVADTDDGITFGAAGASGTQHTWVVTGNVIERTNGNGMLLSITNEGSGAQGQLTFQKNTFRNVGGTSFTLVQDNVKLSTLLIKDCVFNVQRTGMQLSGIVGMVDNATFIGSVKEDIVLTDGLLDVHNTPVDPLKLKPVGTAAAFNVWFHLQVNVVWAGTGKPVIGAVVQMADSGGNTFFVGSIANSSGIPDRDLWSYTKSAQGVLGRTPFRVDVTYFEIEQIESVDLFQNRVVTIELRDNVNPTVVISNPDDHFGTRGYTIQVDGSVFDSQSGFVFDINDPQLPSMYVEMSTDAAIAADPLDWTNAHVKSSSAFEVQFDYLFSGLTEDVHALLVRVHDDANNYVTRTIPVSIDRTAPIVRILTPVTPSIITNKQTVTISAETEVGALIFVNGQQPPEILTRPDFVHAYFTMELPVFEGPNTITVAAIDALNNQGEASVFALVDLQPPYLAVTKPDVDALTNSSSMRVEGQTERVNVTVTVNGIAATIDALGNFSVTIPLALDVNRLNILATDAAGNTQLIVRDVRVDRTAPWINVQSPVSNALLNSAEVDVVGIVEPGAKLIVNDEVVSAPTGAFTRRILLTEGENAIQFVAIDQAGNTGFLTRLVTVDSIDPVIVVDAPANESLINAANVVVSGTVSDDHSVSLLMNGLDIQLGPGGTYSFVATLFEGTNFITLEATDGAGNHITRVMMVVSDTVAPIVLPELEGTFLDGAQVTTYGNQVTVLGFAEKGSELSVCSVPAGSTAEVCNAIPLAADGKFQTFVELRGESLNTINVTATDAAGNEATRQLQVVQKTQPVAAAPPAPVGLYALYLVGLGLLGGAFFLLYMRRGRPGAPQELASAETMPFSTPSDQPAPQMGGDLGAASPEMTAAPEISGDAEVTTAPVEGLEGGAPTGAPEAAVATEAPRSRPMRRRPAGELGGEGAEGGALTGMGAEEEALPGDTHQEEQKEG